MVPLLLFMLFVSFSLSAMEADRTLDDDPMHVEPSFSYESPFEAPELTLNTMSFDSIVHQLEHSIEFAYKADTLPSDRKNELKSFLGHKHIILFYDIFKKLSLPLQAACSQEKNDSHNGQVYFLKSGIYLNSNTNLKTTKIWNLATPLKDLYALEGCISHITQDEKYVLLFKDDIYSLYAIDTGNKIFSCQFNEWEDILLYEAECNVWSVLRNSKNNFEHLSTILKTHSDATYVFVVNMEIAIFNKYTKHDRFLKHFMQSHSLKHRFIIREDNKYALLETATEIVIFNLETMQFITFPTGFRSAMSTNGTYALRRLLDTEKDIQVLDLTKLPNLDPIMHLESPHTDCSGVQNLAISPDGKHALIAFYDERKGSKPRAYHHLRLYMLYNTETGKSTILNTGDYDDLREITDYHTEYITFDEIGNVIIARDNVYYYNFLESIPSSLTLSQYSFLIQLSLQKNVIQYCQDNKNRLRAFVNEHFTNPQVKDAVIEYFGL